MIFTKRKKIAASRANVIKTATRADTLLADKGPAANGTRGSAQCPASKRVPKSGINMALALAAAAAIFLFALSAPYASLRAKSARSEDSVKEQLITFLQTKGDLSTISPSSTLYPLRKVPITATTTLLALRDEPALLELLYPRLSTLVFSVFDERNRDRSGLLKGKLGKGGAVISPALNSLADLELFSLGLIAQRIGRYDDALDLLMRSRRFSAAITERFYDPSREYFFPIEPSGAPEIGYSPEFLLPLVLDEMLGETEKIRMCEKFLSASSDEQKRHGNNDALSEAMKDPDIGIPVYAILSTIPEFRSTALPRLKHIVAGMNAQSKDTKNAWTRFWTENTEILEDLLSGESRSLILCSELSDELKKCSLVAKGNKDPFVYDLSRLKKTLEQPAIDIESFREATGTTNRLIVRLSKVIRLVNSQNEIWKVFEPHVWNNISPRTRRIVIDAFDQSLDDLKRYKVVLSRKFSAASGIVSYVNMPHEPVYQGNKIDFKASLKSLEDTLRINNAFIQIGDLRWRMTEKKSVTLNPGGYPISFESKLSLPPSTKPGIITLPVFFDLMCNGKRLELHHIESVYFSRGVAVDLSYPEGKKIGKGPITINVNVRYRASHDIQGEVEGNFLKELVTNPKLPARFLIKKGQDVVSLPIVINAARNITPGRYPFSLDVSIDNAKVASLNDRLVKPIRWLHLGPIAKEDLINKSALDFQNELLSSQTVSSGKTIMWREIPWGAIDNDGAIRVNMMYPEKKNGCVLLYTAFDALSQNSIHWEIISRDEISFWLNSEPITTKKMGSYKESGVVELRKGINTILLASSWERGADELLFEVSDENGLPPFEIKNDIERLIDGFERLIDRAKAPESKETPSERLKEVTFKLHYPEAKSVSVIGTFNDWDPDANPMTLVGGGIWKASLYLAPGRYTYKFLIDKKLKVTDPANSSIEPDGFGGNNSVLIVK